jgi:hypothetical protein
MLNWKAITLAMLLVFGSCLSLVSDSNANQDNAIVTNSDLMKEIRALRQEIGLLREEISTLRSEIGNASVLKAPPKEQPGFDPLVQKPVISFSEIPRSGGGAYDRADIAGKITGLKDPGRYKIVLYAFTDQWYIQPVTDAPFTDINPDGTWRHWTHLGNRYAAVLVESSFRPMSTIAQLPSIGKMVLAVQTVSAEN